MKTAVNETISQESGPILQLKRPLLSIDEYAAREGISRGIVQECGNLGIIRIRKHRGKTFVVDMPVSPYSETYESTTEAAQPADKAAMARKISEFVQKAVPAADEPSRSNLDSDRGMAGRISRLFEKILCQASKLRAAGKLLRAKRDEARETGRKPERLQSIRHEDVKKAQLASDKNLEESVFERVEREYPKPSRPIVEPRGAAGDGERTKEMVGRTRASDSKADARTEQARNSAGQGIRAEDGRRAAKAESGAAVQAIKRPLTTVGENDRKEKLTESAALQAPGTIGSPPRFASALHNNWPQFDTLGAQARSRRTWQIATVISLVFLFVAVCMSFWLYVDRRLRLGELDRTYMNTQRVYSSLVEARKDNTMIQVELDGFKAGARRLQDQLGTSKAEVERLQNGLESSRAEFKAVQAELGKVEKQLDSVQSNGVGTANPLSAGIRKLATWLVQPSANQGISAGSGSSGN